MRAPFFSVVIPVYNRAAELRPAIASVRAQTFQDFEIVVVDDGSRDNPQEVIESFRDPRIHFIRQPNAGGGAARNRGIDETRGRFVAFLDSDDVFLPHHLASMHALLKDTQDIAGYARVWVDRFEGAAAQVGQMQKDFVARLAHLLGAEIVKTDGPPTEIVKTESLPTMRKRPPPLPAIDRDERANRRAPAPQRQRLAASPPPSQARPPEQQPAFCGSPVACWRSGSVYHPVVLDYTAAPQPQRQAAAQLNQAKSDAVKVAESIRIAAETEAAGLRLTFATDWGSVMCSSSASRNADCSRLPGT